MKKWRRAGVIFCMALLLTTAMAGCSRNDRNDKGTNGSQTETGTNERGSSQESESRTRDSSEQESGTNERGTGDTERGTGDTERGTGDTERGTDGTERGTGGVIDDLEDLGSDIGSDIKSGLDELGTADDGSAAR